jgi:hypothetical protein
MITANETLAKTIVKELGKHLDCFGAFDMTDPVCKKHCSLSLRCIIEKNRSFQMDMMDDFMQDEYVPMRLN